MFRVYVGLGSNLGDRLAFLRNAVSEIAEIAQIHAISSVYETEPVGYKHQPEFLNLAVEIMTALSPPDLLKQLKAIEKEVGRRHADHLQPREIDIDILLYVDFSFEDDTVSVPHPELQNRRFVLEPLNEIAPDVLHPKLRQSISSLLQHCPDASWVERTSLVVSVDPVDGVDAETGG